MASLGTAVRAGIKRASRNRLITFPLSVLVRIKAFETMWVNMARKFPRNPLLAGMCSFMSRQASTRQDRYRAISEPRMLVDISDIYKGLYFFGEPYEPATTRTIRQLVKPGDVVCDVGANLGYFSFLMAELVGENGKVHSFEPNPVLGDVFEKSLSLNGYRDRVVLNRAAVTNRSSESANFYISQDKTNSGLSSLHMHEWGTEHGFFSKDDKVSVQTTNLNDYFARERIERCSFLKIDVEGGEAEVVRGMDILLKTVRPKAVILETRANGEADQLMRSAGYRPTLLKGDGALRNEPDESFWGNICYSLER